MTYYAFLDENEIVIEVIAGVDENELIEGDYPETWYSKFRGLDCKATYLDGSDRKNFAGIGYTYDRTLDAFIPPKPYPSWQLNETSCQWESPIAFPLDGANYIWNETTKEWEPING